MAIFSLNHSFIGRTTHPAGSASLFARYITRHQACTVVAGGRMPIEGSAMMAWLDEQEQGDRKNARVIDKVVVALPKELTREQNIALLEAYGERMTQGRASWAAAIHDGPGDADNPHAHIIFRDRDVDTGKRVMMTTEKGSTGQFREGWEEEVNRSLEREGFDERVDRRSLKDQGIDREPQLHVGAGAEKLRDKQHEFQSAQIEITRLIDGAPTLVTVNYPVIDQGKTRFEENEARKARNLERELAMDGIFDKETELQELYYKALQSEVPKASSETDLLPWLVAIHIAERDAARTREDRLEAEAGPPGGDLDGKPPRKGLSDLIAGAGLAIIGKIADSIESIFDGPARLTPERERELPMQDKEKIDAMRREQAERQPVQDDQARQKAIEYQAWLDERRRLRGFDRGR